MRVLSIFAGKPRSVTGPGPGPLASPFESSILKDPVEGAVPFDRTGVIGDEQADKRVHGGPDKAVCVYFAGHYAAWRDELGDDLALDLGGFGENLAVDEVNEDTVAIGDRFEAASGLVLEVTQPRAPCWKLARRWGVGDMAARVLETGRTGWYCRVLVPGILQQDQTLDRTSHRHAAWTIGRANSVYHAAEHSHAALELAEIPPLSAAVRSALYRFLGRDGYSPMDCAVHDLLEDAAVRRVPLDLTLGWDDGASDVQRARVTDLRTEEGAEYVELGSSRLIRLDRILRVEPVVDLGADEPARPTEENPAAH